jgi:CDP-diacylglycerol--glycerol-3-phosphate 3-phosphatidyltransferase
MARRGVSREEENHSMFDGRWRGAVDAKTAPVGSWLNDHGITADVLTATGLVSAAATAVAIGAGYFILAIVLLTLTGAHDLFDGPVAKASGTASIRGAFFDSVTDRVADALLMGGCAWYLISAKEGRLVMIPLAIMAVTALISYERAKAETLGIPAKGGLMERAERMILLGVGLVSSLIFVPVLIAMLCLTSLTAMGRFIRIWQAASAPDQKWAIKRRNELSEARLREWRSRPGAHGGRERRSSTPTWRSRMGKDRSDTMSTPTGRWSWRRSDSSRPQR